MNEGKDRNQSQWEQEINEINKTKVVHLKGLEFSNKTHQRIQEKRNQANNQKKRIKWEE
jgi:hypothetical protein